MKFSLWVLALSLLLAFSACGNNNATGDEKSSKANRTGTPEIASPPGPAPKELVIREIKRGSGPPARRGDLLEVYYVAVNSETKEQVFHRWRPVSPLRYRIGYANWGPGWQKGIEGMREGGRRELLIPARLTLDTTPLDYVIEVASLEPLDRSGGDNRSQARQ